MTPEFPFEEKKAESRRGTTLFGRQKPELAASPDIAEHINSMNARLRLLEERYTNLDRKFEILESNMLEEQKKIGREIKALSAETTETRGMMEELKDKMEIILNELKAFASKEEMDTLRKYIDLWDPIRFATKAELERALKSKEE